MHSTKLNKQLYFPKKLAGTVYILEGSVNKFNGIFIFGV